MKQELAVQSQVSEKELISYLDTLGLTSKLTEPEKSAYINIAKAFGLNPFKREIHVSKYGDTMSIITGYEVYIKRAERTGQLDGWSVTSSGSVATGDLKATVTIYRKDRQHPFVWEALYDECVQLTRDGKVTKFWQKAAFMTKKVAISQGFRLCFSDELAGMPYTADEIQEIQQFTEDVTHEEVKDEPKVEKVDWDFHIMECKTKEELTAVWKDIPKEYRTDYLAKVKQKGVELEGEAA